MVGEGVSVREVIDAREGVKGREGVRARKDVNGREDILVGACLIHLQVNTLIRVRLDCGIAVAGPGNERTTIKRMYFMNIFIKCLIYSRRCLGTNTTPTSKVT